MKKIVALIAFAFFTTTLLHADRADMDRLGRDIDNHNTHLGELVTAKDASSIKKSARSLREDVKALGRKATGLSEQQTSQLDKRVADIVERTQKIEDSADKSDFAGAQSAYLGLQPQIQQLQRQTAVQVGAAAVAEKAGLGVAGSDKNLMDLKNHARKVQEALQAKSTAEVNKSTGYLRDDLRAWVKGRSALDATENKRITTAETEIIALTGKIERNAAKGEWSDAREFARKIDKLVAGLETPAVAIKEKKN